MPFQQVHLHFFDKKRRVIVDNSVQNFLVLYFSLKRLSVTFINTDTPTVQCGAYRSANTAK